MMHTMLQLNLDRGRKVVDIKYIKDQEAQMRTMSSMVREMVNSFANLFLIDQDEEEPLILCSSMKREDLEQNLSDIERALRAEMQIQ